MSQRALLVDAASKTQLCSALQDVLHQHFQLNVLRKPNSVVVFDDDKSDCSIQDVITSFDPLVIFLILSPQLQDNGALLQSVKKAASMVPIIAVLEHGEPQDVFDLLRQGATDFITPPLNASNVLPRTWKLLEPAPNGMKQTPLFGRGANLQQLVGESPGFVNLLKRIPQIANCDANVLIQGETGTGKEVYARAIHYRSSRAGTPFVPVNCGAIPVELVENELFGHERGAFTSAMNVQAGLIEEANNGTLLLDEIDCLPMLAQVKLLRFLQEREYKPLGSTRIRRADVRIIAASNTNLAQAVESGRMRRDLYYRINIIGLTLPSLRERREDIPLLSQYFLAKYAATFNKPIEGISTDALNLLMSFDWPGNVRELEHVIERATIMSENSQLEAEDLELPASFEVDHCRSLQEAKAKQIASFEKNYIQGVLRICGGNITRAAQVAQKNRRAFWQLIQKHQIDVSRFKQSLG